MSPVPPLKAVAPTRTYKRPGPAVVQQASMVKEGAAALGRVYRVELEILANVFAGRMTDVGVPKGLSSTPEIDKMVDASRNLVMSIVKDEYVTRGRIENEEGPRFGVQQNVSLASS